MIWREGIVGISIPFTVGVALGAVVVRLTMVGPMQASIVALCTLIVVCVGLFCCIYTQVGSLTPLWALVYGSAGLFCYCSYLSIGCPEGAGPLLHLAHQSVEHLKSLICSIPYAHEQSAALAQALLTGDRSLLSRSTLSAFRSSGASHLLALSGLHLGFIYMIIRRISGSLPYHGRTASKVRAIVTVGLCGFYTLMTGAGPSIVRAFLFICIREIAGSSPERRLDLGRTLLCSQMVQLALRPSAITSVSFQLSYLAMTGIVFILPHLQAWYPQGSRHDPLRRIWDISALSISCQAMTAPAAWYYFRTFPKYFLLTNLLALPLCSIVMTVSILAIALNALGLCPGWLIIVDDWTLQIFIRVLQIISTM